MCRDFDVWLVHWVRMILRVAVPVPEPEGVGLENAVLEDRLGSGPAVRVEQKPQQLFVISV